MVTKVERDHQAGQTYLAYDMGDRSRPVIHTLLRRMSVDEDVSDGWGHHGGKTPYGWYWYVLDVLRGEVIVSIDNQYENSNWELL